MSVNVWESPNTWATSGVTVTGATANYNYSAITALVEVGNEVVVIGSTANYDYSALNATILIQGDTKANYKYVTRVNARSNITRVK